MPEPSFEQAWRDALAGLELDLDRAESMLRVVQDGAPPQDVTGLGSWAPPTGLGPLPESLVERARVVLARQLAVVEDLTTAAIHSRQRVELHRRLRADAVSRPLFVDASF